MTNMLTNWENRPQVTANLNNPAFCAEIIRIAAKAYFDTSTRYMPFSLSMFILPLILPSMIREKLPRTTKTSLHHWLNDNDDLRIKIIENTRGFLLFTKEALMFSISHMSLSLTDVGCVKVLKTTSPAKSDDSEVNSCFAKATLVGKLLAKAGDEYTIYSLIGVKP